jgi:prepilin peptidase CpaA
MRSMGLFTLDKWPLVFICIAMIVAAVIDGWKLKVPNWLTFPLILSGWALGLSHNFGWFSSSGEGGIGAALAGTVVGFLLLLPLYAIGGMGAGDVKMQMGFGSWVGAFIGMPAGLDIIFYGFCTGVIVGGILALGLIVLRGQYRQTLANAREILGDWAGSRSVGEVAEKAGQRKARLQLLPYGIPLCLGFVGYLVYKNW